MPDESGRRESGAGPAPESDADVIQFPGAMAPPEPAQAAPEPAPAPPAPDPVPQSAPTLPKRQPGRQAIVPEPWQRSNIRGTLRHLAGLQWHRTRFHGLRLPGYVLAGIVWAAVGLTRIVFAQLAWWWVAEQSYLRMTAVQDGDARTWMTLHKHAREARLVRGCVLLAELVAILVAGVLVTVLAIWVWPIIAVVAIPLLAIVGRPVDKPIVQQAVVPVHVQPLSKEVIVQALGSVGIGAINNAITKDPDNAIVLVNPIMRDGPGWRADIDLPLGVTAGMIMDKREQLASGLRRPIGCVWPEGVRKQHPGRLVLWVGDEDMSEAEQPAWPLAKVGAVDLFQPQQFGTDQRFRAITVLLMFANVIIGSVPRMGKTFLLRLLLLIAALDARAELHVYDLKGTGDLAPLRPVAHRYRPGDEPDDMTYMLEDFRSLRKELRRRTKVIRDLPSDICPENKVTPELASRRDLRLHPIVVGVDECQVAFEHPIYGAEFEEICTDLVKRGPAVGIVLLLATQRPDAKSIPTGISANAVLRMCLKVMGQTENDMVLGQSMHKNGVRATMFALEDKGILYYAGEGQAARIMRSHGLDAPAAERVVARARILRERAGTLSGYALGLDLEEDAPRSFTADVLMIFGTDNRLWCETIATRLAESIPGVYADTTQEAVASQLRALGVTVKKVRETGREPRSGCERAAVAEATETPDA